MNAIVESLLEVKLKSDKDFLKIRETLSRIGIASKDSKVLYQSCHILHKRGKYFITHFKELFLLDGKETNLDESDIARRNKIALLLQEWNMIDIVDESKVNPVAPMDKIKIVPYAEKSKWQFITKYKIGKKKRENA